MIIKYKLGGKMFRRDVWLPYWSGQRTEWPPRRKINMAGILGVISVLANS